MRRSAFVQRYDDSEANKKKIKKIFDDIIPNLKSVLITAKNDAMKNERRSSFRNSALI